MRTLSRISKAARARCQALLEVGERRTLEKLLDRAGIRAATTNGTVSVEDFLRCQRFVPADNAGLKALWALAVR